jgi:hypothetical protein
MLARYATSSEIARRSRTGNERCRRFSNSMVMKC